MNDEITWITKNGVHIPLTNEYMNRIIRKNNKDNTFVTKSGKKMIIEKKQEDWGNYYWGKISAMYKGEEAGTVEYLRPHNLDSEGLKELDGAKLYITGIEVKEQYRREGIGTRLYKEIGKISNYEEIQFGNLTESGKKLAESVAVITRKVTYLGEDKYFGKIKE